MGGSPQFFRRFSADYGGGWLCHFGRTMGGWFTEKNRPEGPIFWRRRRLWAAKPPKIGPPLGENFFFWKNFYSGKIFQMPFRLTIRNRVLVSKMSIFEGTIFVFRKICQIFPNFYNSVDSCEKTKITFAKTLNGSWKNLTEKSKNFLDFF